MKTGSVLAGVIFVGIACLWCVPNQISDLRWLRTTNAIRASILRDLPMGTDYQTVERYFRKTSTVRRSLETGPAIDFKGHSLGGEGFIRADLGGYWFILRVDVQAIAVFSDGGKLRDILVSKSTEAP